MVELNSYSNTWCRDKNAGMKTSNISNYTKTHNYANSTRKQSKFSFLWKRPSRDCWLYPRSKHEQKYKSEFTELSNLLKTVYFKTTFTDLFGPGWHSPEVDFGDGECLRRYFTFPWRLLDWNILQSFVSSRWYLLEYNIRRSFFSFRLNHQENNNRRMSVAKLVGRTPSSKNQTYLQLLVLVVAFQMCLQVDSITVEYYCGYTLNFEP